MIHSLAVADSVRQDALLAMLQREELMRQLQVQQRQIQQHQQQFGGDHIASNLLSFTGRLGADGTADFMSRHGLLHEARQARLLQNEQLLQQQEILANQLLAIRAARQRNLGETKQQDLDPHDDNNDLLTSQRRLNQR